MATKATDAPAKKKTGRTTAARRIRKIFGNIHEISEMPNLIEVQRESYEQFLRSDPATGYISGLEKTLRSVFPIMDFAGTAHLDFAHYELEHAKYDSDECRPRRRARGPAQLPPPRYPSPPRRRLASSLFVRSLGWPEAKTWPGRRRQLRNHLQVRREDHPAPRQSGGQGRRQERPHPDRGDLRP